MIKNEMTFNGVDFGTQYHAYIATSNFLDGASKDIESIKVLGRSGNLQIDNHRFNNITLKVTLYITENMQTNMNALRNYLASCVGYKTYTETLTPGEYRMASFKQAFAPEVYDTVGGTVELEFDCMPQRWLTAGQAFTTFTADGTITNNTLFNAKPLLRVYGSGQFGIGAETLTLSQAGQAYIDIDCESMNAYEGSTNMNQYLTVTDFPVLAPGSNGVTLGAGITKIEIMPRWYNI